MSKFNDYFDNVEVKDELEQRVLTRVREEKIQNSVAAQCYHGTTVKKRPRRFNPAILAIVCVFSLFLILPVLSFTAIAILNSVSNPVFDFSRARQVQSERHLSSVLAVNDPRPRQPLNLSLSCSSRWVFDGAQTPDSPSLESSDRDNSGMSSTTFTQVDGMDEGDIVKNDGQFIYRLSPLGLTIVETNRGYITPVTSIAYTNFAPIEMFVRGNQMIIIGGGFNNHPNHHNWNNMHGGFMHFRAWHTRTQIRVYDISDITIPVLERFYEIDGNFYTSRIREECGTLFFAVNYWTRRWCPDTWGRQLIMPYYRSCPDKDFTPFPVEKMFYFRNNPTHSFMILGRIDLNDPDSAVHKRAYLSGPGIISVSTNHMFVSTQQWFFNSRGMRNEQRSHIARFCLENLSFTGAVTVAGRPPDRRAIDEHNGYLRVAATYGDWWSRNSNNFASAIFVFNSNLQLVSSIRNIAPGETMDSAAFSGNFGYISTSPPWLIWDPLYTVDLTDPYNPTISEGLETDGINQLLIAIDGTPFAIGIGQDALPGGSALQSGIKIELYDMKPGTGLMPESKAKFTVYGTDTFAEVIFNPRALLFVFCDYTKQGLVGFAAESSNWNTVFAQGFFLFGFDAAAGTMDFIGTQTEDFYMPNFAGGGSGEHVNFLIPSFSNFDTDQYIFSWNQSGWQTWSNNLNRYISRAIINNGFLYTVADGVIAGYCLTTLEQIDKHTGV